mmetsp:Transcript_40246/g.119521  ORF Transcript_40246/g.119521 Transcript_40246/m.119521 type:complete len:238 (-) Transcript_40246:926-1639(-)
MASITRRSFFSHWWSTSTMLSSVSASRASSMSTPSRRSARCSTPALIATSTLASRSCRCRCRSCVRPAGSGDATCGGSSPASALYLSRCMRSCASRFLAVSLSMSACASAVICSRFLCVVSCVRNFSITSLTSDTPVASLISRKAASYARIFSCSSAMSASLTPARSPSAPLSRCAAARASRRAFSRRSSSVFASVRLATSAFRSASCLSRRRRSSATACSNLASSCLASSLEWFAS